MFCSKSWIYQLIFKNKSSWPLCILYKPQMKSFRGEHLKYDSNATSSKIFVSQLYNSNEMYHDSLNTKFRHDRDTIYEATLSHVHIHLLDPMWRLYNHYLYL